MFHKLLLEVVDIEKELKAKNDKTIFHHPELDACQGMQKGVKVRIYMNMDNKYHPWESLSDEEQKEIGSALNDKALRAIGYLPVTEVSEKTWENY